MRPPTSTIPKIVKPLPPELFTERETGAEMRWAAMAGQGYHTPVDRFFVRNHTATPLIEPSTWRLRVHGDGLAGALDLTYGQLLAMPARTIDAAVECAGNGRRFYGTQQGRPAPGTQWGLGAIGVARWRGVPLRHVLERAGLRPDAREVLATGLDEPFEEHGHVRRPLPLAKALDDVLIAYEMNGRPLPPDHGFPARLIVPGWAGIASIKWLGELEVSPRPLFTPWNTLFYRDVTTMPVKSAFAVDPDATFAAGRPHLLSGRSWSGTGRIVAVEVSLDGGASWRPAEHRGRHLAGAWLPWHVTWRPEHPGRHVLLARARDESGAGQPLAAEWQPSGYHFDAVVQHPVWVTHR
ncbi:sulfite oxidase [Nonomuraea sp. NPDC050310]|uniref:sulfite oxidase n=1 Tax=unclassified Nonomuraea TaxID=2593643 RepID=UPI0033CB70EB